MPWPDIMTSAFVPSAGKHSESQISFPRIHATWWNHVLIKGDDNGTDHRIPVRTGSVCRFSRCVPLCHWLRDPTVGAEAYRQRASGVARRNVGDRYSAVVA